MPNAWDRPAWPSVGDGTQDDIYPAVGRALTAWCETEEAIAYLFSTVVEAGIIGAPVNRAYSSISGVRNRIRMVREAADAWFAQLGGCPKSDDLFRILTICEKWSERRNEIAHGGVDLDVDMTSNSWFLYPGYFTTKRQFGTRAEFRYTASQIDKIAEGFGALHEDLSALATELREWRKSK
jgi:hypothetical protein